MSDRISVTSNVACPTYVNRVCYHPCELKPTAPWKAASVSTRTEFVNIVCKQQPYVSAFVIPSIVPRFKPIVYNSCLGNEVAAMYNRYFPETPEVNLDLGTFYQCLEELCSLIEKDPIKPMDFIEFLETKRGSLGRRYRKACDELLDDGFDLRKDSKVTPFVKNEKYLVDGKPPRLVYSRDPKFTTMYARYILPIEHSLVKNVPQVAKGKNFMQRGAMFQSLVYGKQYAENDMSKFEASQRAELTDRVQYYMFERWYRQYLNELTKLYEAKMHKRGHTLKGAAWKVWSLMASGDIETGCFNTIYNWLSCRYFEVKNNQGHGNFIVDGDDSVIQVSGGSLVNTFTDFGFDAKLIFKQDYHDVEFCSSKFIQIRPGTFYQVQNLNKLFDSVPYMINKQFDDHLSDYYGSLGYMYAVLYKGIPVLSNFASFLQTASQRPVSMKMLEATHYGAVNAFRAGHLDIGVVDVRLAVVELSMCFELHINELLTLSKWFDGHHLQFPESHNREYKSRDRLVRPKHSVFNYSAIRTSSQPYPRPKPTIKDGKVVWTYPSRYFTPDLDSIHHGFRHAD